MAAARDERREEHVREARVAEVLERKLAQLLQHRRRLTRLDDRLQKETLFNEVSKLSFSLRQHGKQLTQFGTNVVWYELPERSQVRKNAEIQA